MRKTYFRILIIVAILSCFLVSNFEAQGQQVVLDVPMIMVGGMPAIEVKVNGEGPFVFGIDTGAQGMGRADTTLVERLKLQPTSQRQVGDGSGKTTTLNIFKFDSVSIGSIDFKNIEVLSRNYNVRPDVPKIDGILGFNLLADYLLVLDYPAKRVRLEKGELPKADGIKILDFENPRGIPVIELKVGNSKIKAHIDSGNMVGGFVFPHSVIEKSPLASEPKVVGRARTVTGEMEIKQVSLKDTIYFGENSYTTPIVVYPALGENANIGARVLSDYILTFDQKNKRVKLEKSALRNENPIAAEKVIKQSAQIPMPIEIPFTLDGNRLIVKVKINGKGDFSFIFDTGAQGVVLNESVSDALGLKGEGFTPLGSPNNPNAYQAKNIDIPLFTVNGFESKNEEAVAVDFKKVFPTSKHDGIFGLSTFKGYLVTINYPESKLIIRQGELKEGETGVVKVDLSRILALTAKLDGKEIPVHLDSGSPSFITFPIEWKPNLKLKSEPTFRGKGRTASGEFDLYEAKLMGKIEFGSVSINDPDIILKTGGFPAANFGYAFLKNYLLTIDTVNRRLQMLPVANSVSETNQTASPANTNDCRQYAGEYGNRRVTCEEGQLYSQRIISEQDQNPTGPKIVAPKLKLISVGIDEFRIEQVSNGRIKFLKDSSGAIVEMQVLNPQGEWEKSRRKM